MSIGIKINRTLEKMREEAKVELLCNTDYKSLLEACRDLCEQVKLGNIKPNTYYLDYVPNNLEISLPEIILNLKPGNVTITSGYVRIVLHGGTYYLGVYAYYTNYSELPSHITKFKDEDIELIPGLWYYDYETTNTSSREKIDSMIQIGRAKLKENEAESDPNNISP